LEGRLRNRFPSPTSVKQLKEVIREEWHETGLEPVRNLCNSIPRRISSVLKAKVNPEPY
jgi:hypothetical protein